MAKRSSKASKEDLSRTVLDAVRQAKEQGQRVSDLIKQQAEEMEAAKHPAAVAFGRLGGLKGEKARAERLSAGRRKLIAREAARKR